MRDPAERTISHYWHMVRHHREWRPIARAIKDDPQFVAVSHYSMQLQPFLECFGRDRIAILTYEEVVKNPALVIKRLWGWLGLQQSAVDLSALAVADNVTPDDIRAARWRGLPRLLWHTPPLRGVSRYTPETMMNVLRQVTTRTVSRGSVDLAEVYAFLRPIQTHQTKELTALLGQDFPDWNSVDRHNHDRPTERPKHVEKVVHGI
jgi:hypothetical protein